MLPSRFAIATLGLCLLFMVLAGCAKDDSLTGADLLIQEPADGAVIGTEEVTIKGTAKPDTDIALDRSLGVDKKFKADSQGNWEFKQRLDKGRNELAFHLTDNEDVKAKITITYDPTVTTVPSAEANPATETPNVEDQVANAYRANMAFMPRASADDMVVNWTPADGLVQIDIRPKGFFSEADSLTVAGASAIVASRAIWTSFPAVKEIAVLVWADFTDATGKSTKQIAASTTITRPTGEKFNYDGIRDRAASDNKLFFCGADEYRIHPAVYDALKDKGCLAQWGLSK